MIQEKISPQNLIRQVSAEPPYYTRPGFYKPLIFDIVGFLAALGVGFAYKQYLDGGSDLTWVFLTLTAFAAISLFQTFFARGIKRRFLSLILEVAAILIFFISSEVQILLLSAASMLLFILWGDMLGRSELESRLELKFFKVARPTLQKLATALALLLVVLYLPRIGQTNGFVSKETFRGFFDSLSNVTKNFYPEINLTSSMGDFAKSIAAQDLQYTAAFKVLPDAEKDLVLKQTTDQIVENIGNRLGMAISPSESVGNALYDFFVNILGKWRAASEYWFIIGWAITAFIVLRGFGTIFYWIVGLIAFLLYQILLATDFIHIAGETMTHEVIEF